VRSARHFVYRYDGNAESDEVDYDPDGTTPIPKQNSIVLRNGLPWRVTAVQVEITGTEATVLPIFRVFLDRA